MENHKKWLSWLTVLLFFGAVTLIALGLRQLSTAAALIFLGLALLYLGYCLNQVIHNDARRDEAK